VSLSKDLTIRVWDLRNPLPSQTNKTHFEDIPVTIFDHKTELLSADILRLEKPSSKPQMTQLLASVDIEGNIYIRSLKVFKESDIEQVLIHIRIPDVLMSQVRFKYSQNLGQHGYTFHFRLLFSQDMQIESKIPDLFLLTSNLIMGYRLNKVEDPVEIVGKFS
jgi:hypothetical protein